LSPFGHPRYDPAGAGGYPDNGRVNAKTVRIDIEHVPGGSSLTGRPGRFGYADVAGCPDRPTTLLNLLRQALAVVVDSWEQSR
jgi:hypothetical protein